ncbi:hypothetical protein PM082_024495 [Marasmius tenuissimus]|nr:hypothetical protein PM082_024495 [Marasmius tenuissimus]
MVSLLKGLSMSPVEEVSWRVAPAVKFIWAQCSVIAVQIQTSEGFHDTMIALRSSPAIPVIGHVLNWLRTNKREYNNMILNEQEMMNFNDLRKQHYVVDLYLWWHRHTYNLRKLPLIQQYLRTTFSSLGNIPMDGPSQKFTTGTWGLIGAEGK